MPFTSLTEPSHSSSSPQMRPPSNTKCHPCPWAPKIYPRGTLAENSVSDPDGACRVPWEGEEPWLWGFEGQVGVDNTWKETLFHLYPWTIMEDWEVGEEKEDGFYLMGPLWVRMGVAQDDPQLFQSSIFLFFKKLLYLLWQWWLPVAQGGQILCVSLISL